MHRVRSNRHPKLMLRKRRFVFRTAGGVEDINWSSVCKPDHSPTHFRDPEESEEISKKTNFFEGEVLVTNDDIRYGIFEAFANL